MLLASDLAALALAYGFMLAANALDGRPVVDGENITAFILTVPIWLFLASTVGLYQLYGQRVDHTFVDELLPVFMVGTVWVWFLTGVDSALDVDETQLYGASALWFGGLVAVLSLRALTRRLATRRAWFRQPVLLIGGRNALGRVHDRIARHPECGLDPAVALRIEGSRATLLDLGDEERFELGRTTIAPGRDPEQLAEWVAGLGLDRVIIAGPVATLGERGELVRAFAAGGITVDEVAAEPEALLSTAVLHHLEGLPVLTVRPAATTRGALIAKRSLDFCVSLLALLVVAPALPLIAARIKLGSRGPVLFRQQRVGRNGETFELLKFRTMVDGAEQMRDPHTHNGRVVNLKQHDDPRVTAFGARLRRWSIDELPQLWNVLRGDMSLVGPRPLPLPEAELVDERFALRTSVRPGLTGAWQVHGRSEIPFEEMLQLDYTYVVTWTIREDLRLLARTISAVARRRGAY